MLILNILSFHYSHLLFLINVITTMLILNTFTIILSFQSSLFLVLFLNLLTRSLTLIVFTTVLIINLLTYEFILLYLHIFIICIIARLTISITIVTIGLVLYFLD